MALESAGRSPCRGEIYGFVQDYALANKIGFGERLFDIMERQVQRHLNKGFVKMGLPLGSYGSHSYRKYFSQKVYVENGYNIELVRTLLQHSSVAEDCGCLYTDIFIELVCKYHGELKQERYYYEQAMVL